MMLKKFLLANLLILNNSLFTQANSTIRLGLGRISLIDLGAIIKPSSIINDNKSVRVYLLSTLLDTDNKNIIALQGLIDQGTSEIIINTNSGIKRINIELDDHSSTVVCLSQCENLGIINLRSNDLLLVHSSNQLNDTLLASNSSLIKAEHIVDYYDAAFLKTWGLKANQQEGFCDIVIPTLNKIYKMTLEIKNKKNEKQINNITLD